MLRAEFGLPQGWISREDSTGALEAAATSLGLDDGQCEILRLALPKVMSFVDQLPGQRDAWVLPNLSGQIDAVLTLRGRPTDSEGRANLLKSLEASVLPNERVDVINRTIRAVVLPSGPALETHDFSVGHDFESGARPASERATVTIFPTSGEWAIDFLLVTQDLLLFEDSMEYLHDIAETVRPFTEVLG
jgi:hypothetical protein